MSERFPDVDWYCDECDEYLNDQRGFNDQSDIWSCSACGHRNNISAEEILSEDEVARALEFLSRFDPRKFSS